MSSLSHSITCRSIMAAGLDGHEVVEPIVGEEQSRQGVG